MVVSSRLSQVRFGGNTFLTQSLQGGSNERHYKSCIMGSFFLVLPILGTTLHDVLDILASAVSRLTIHLAICLLLVPQLNGRAILSQWSSLFRALIIRIYI